MEFTAVQLAAFLGGEIEGNPDAVVNTLSKIEEGQEKSLCFLSNELYTNYIYTTKASIVIVNKSFVPQQSIAATLVKVDDARLSFAKLMEAYQKAQQKPREIHPSSSIDATATIGENVAIGPFCFIGANTKIESGVTIHSRVTIEENCVVGENSIIASNAFIGHDCKIGKECTLQPAVVIGSDGFGFVPNSNNQYNKVPHLGNVVIGDHVEIGANTTIDRATLGSTKIGTGVKLDNLIQIAHNVEVGENTVIAAQTGVAGSSKIGKNCMIGGQVGIVGHITIADEVKIAAQSGVGQSITEKGAIVQGSPAFAISDYQRSYVKFRKLPQLLDKMEKQLKQLQVAPKSQDHN